METYGINLTPHIEKYQDFDTEECHDTMHNTWNFGNVLKAKGYKVAYMHGPIGLYEDIVLNATKLPFKTKDHPKEFMKNIDKKEVIFLFQKLTDGIRYTTLTQTEIELNRKSKKALDKPSKKG